MKKVVVNEKQIGETVDRRVEPQRTGEINNLYHRWLLMDHGEVN